MLVLAAIVLRLASADLGSVQPAKPDPVDVLAPQAEMAERAPLAAGLSPTAEQGTASLHGADEIQICGGGWVKTQADGSLDQADIERATRLPEARLRVVAKLKSDNSDLAQAAALMLEMTAAGADIAQVRDALARRVASSTDPRAYALAYNTCGSGDRSEGACSLLSAAQWARLDPGNASPWLATLGEARARKDRVLEDEAMHRIATSQRSDLGFFVLPGLILDAAPAEDAFLVAAFMMGAEAIGRGAAHTLPGYQLMLTACRGTALLDANRQQTCLAIAEVLSERSDTYIERSIGAAMGKQLGWPADRNDRMGGEYEAYGAHLNQKNATGIEDMACGDFRRDLEQMRSAAARGETGALREWVAQSGKKAEDFVREQRARQKIAAERALEQMAAAPAAASAASAVRPSSASAPP